MGAYGVIKEIYTYHKGGSAGREAYRTARGRRDTVTMRERKVRASAPRASCATCCHSPPSSSIMAGITRNLVGQRPIKAVLDPRRLHRARPLQHLQDRALGNRLAPVPCQLGRAGQRLASRILPQPTPNITRTMRVLTRQGYLIEKQGMKYVVDIDADNRRASGSASGSA